jgi:hypothetical protein
VKNTVVLSLLVLLGLAACETIDRARGVAAVESRAGRSLYFVASARPANYWNDTGIDIHSNESYRISAVGGLRNFHEVYKPLVDAWMHYDNSGATPALIESQDNT